MWRHSWPICALPGTAGATARAADVALTLFVARRHLPARPPPLRPPPPLRAPPGAMAGGRGGAAGRLPPPPPLPGRAASAISWKGPQEILSMFVEFVPTFFVPIGCVAATLDEACRNLVRGRGKFLLFVKKYRFFFDVRTTDTGMTDIKLREDLSHPKRGAADGKYEMTDAGEHHTYTVRPEFITNMESIDAANESVSVRAPQAPPSIHVQMEERVPVVDRLKTLMPTQFTMIEEVEEKIPEDILFHPYFDCQGGLPAIASKFPELFQVVDGFIRIRPAHLAPLSTNNLSLDASPLETVARKVKDLVCMPGVPQWVSLTSIYETLTTEEKRAIKKEYKSFAGFLRAHGSSVALSQDTLKASKWLPPVVKKAAAGSAAGSSPPPPSASSPQSATAATTPKAEDAAASSSSAATVTMPIRKVFTQTHVINELFDKFPRNKSMSLEETLGLLTIEMRASLPAKIVPWLATQKGYFVVENPYETNPALIKLHRATDTIPLDLAQALYPFIPDDGISQHRLSEVLPEAVREMVATLGLANVVQSLTDWLELVDGDLFRKKTEADLELAIQSEESKQHVLEDDDTDEENALAAEKERRMAPPMKFEGTMSKSVRR